MNLILIDELNENYELISKSIKRKNNVFEKLSNWKKVDFSGFEKVYIFVAVVNNFASYDTQQFVLNCKEKLNFVTYSTKLNMSEPFVSWINSLIYFNKCDFSICARMTQKTIDSDLELIDGIINDNISKDPKDTVKIYTDGACSGNPGPGGWGIILMHEDKMKEFSGFEPMTTNNRMELTAVVKALSMLKKKCNVEVYSDSAYVVNAINQNWIQGWRNNGWKNSDREQVKNLELWHELNKLITYHNVTFYKVQGHSDNEFNNRCDELATSEIAKNQDSVQ